jgi:hypothetical protein
MTAARKPYQFTVRQPAPGRFEYTSPTGHTYTITPDPLTPVTDNHEETHQTGPPDDPDPPPRPTPVPSDEPRSDLSLAGSASGRPNER